MKFSVSHHGTLSLQDGRRMVFSCRLLPCDWGFDYIAPEYTSVKEVTLGISPVGVPEVLKTDDGITITKRFQGILLRQCIRVTGDACTLETCLERVSDDPLPRSLNIISFTGKTWGKDARVLLLLDDQALVKCVSEVKTGEMSKVIIAEQSEEGAMTISSEVGSDFPLYVGHFRGKWHGMVTLPSKTDHVVNLGKITIRFGQDAQTLLDDFATESAKQTALKPVPMGWNSWNYHYSNISHDRMLENARALAATDFSDRLKWVVLDMGWEIRHGEWEADSHFPRGMDNFAAEIKALGFEPGIWLAPVIVDPECNFVQEDYAWVGRNTYGFPDRTYECCGLFGYILDVTRPEGERWLFNLFRRFRDMGYTYFKIDFLRFLMYVDHFQDESLTKVQVMRKALKVIREAVGEDAFVLGCNLPVEVGPGYVDATRIAADVAVFWECIKRNARTIACNYFLNGKWWWNDPDFLVVNGKDTYTGEKPIFRTWWFLRKDEYEKQPEILAMYRMMHDPNAALSLEEARTHVSLELLLGSSLVLSDPLMYLNEQGKSLLRRVLTAETAPGRPLRLFAESGQPAIWVQRLQHKVRIGVFNWTDERLAISIGLEEIGVSGSRPVADDFWTGAQVAIADDVIQVTLAPHCCRVLEVAG